MLKIEVNKMEETTDVKMHMEGMGSDILDEVTATIVTFADNLLEHSDDDQDVDFEDVLEDMFDRARQLNRARELDELLQMIKELR